MTNPFDLRGPEFLAFYAALGIGITILAIWARRAREWSEPPRPLHDYLEIAYLRGGSDEAIRVAILTLIDRRVLTLSGDDRVQVAEKDAARRVTKQTERAILSSATFGIKASDLLTDKSVKDAAREDCEPELVRRGLLPAPRQRIARMQLWLLTAAILAGVAGVKIAVAIARGRSNVGFLVILAVVFLVVTFLATHPSRTPAGNALMSDLKTLFNGLKDRASSMRPQEGSNDFALLAAVYGVSAALPVYPDARRLFPSGSEGSSDSSGSSSGSSCGSSCGGGGGGCGGCGS
jgi:uncharacterized protein (TIGR04222 family)